MKIKTSELIGAALDWAVAKAEGRTDLRIDEDGELVGQAAFDYSSDWSLAGPIITRESVGVAKYGPSGEPWKSVIGTNPQGGPCCQYGETPLVATMRVYVEFRIGTEVEIPKELAC